MYKKLVRYIVISRNVRDFLAIIAFGILSFGCGGGVFRFYVPKDPNTRKGKGLDLRVGRVFSKGDAICAEINPINWTKDTVKIPRRAVVMELNGKPLVSIDRGKIYKSPTFQKGVEFYYRNLAGIEDLDYQKVAGNLYVERELILKPRDITVRRLICFKLPDNRVRPEERNFSLRIKGIFLRGREVKLKPFEFRELKRDKK